MKIKSILPSVFLEVLIGKMLLATKNKHFSLILTEGLQKCSERRLTSQVKKKEDFMLAAAKALNTWKILSKVKAMHARYNKKKHEPLNTNGVFYSLNRT